MKFSKKHFGTVASGSKYSSKWMPKYIPWLYVGTLNVKMDSVIPEIVWEQEIETHYGQPCRIARCKINGVNAFLINPPEVGIDPPRYLAEIGSKFGLRNVLNLKDGSRVVIRFWINKPK
jgi:CTP-dependent riboflavin kinase